jgi:hypothetical protein
MVMLSSGLSNVHLTVLHSAECASGAGLLGVCFLLMRFFDDLGRQRTEQQWDD